MSDDNDKFNAPGTLTLAVIFLVWFIIIYFVQWIALSDLWIVN